MDLTTPKLDDRMLSMGDRDLEKLQRAYLAALARVVRQAGGQEPAALGVHLEEDSEMEPCLTSATF